MGLVLLQRRARKLRPAGRGGAGGGSGREMHLLNKRRPWRTPREGAGPCRSEAPGGGGRAEPRPRLGGCSRSPARAPSAPAAGPTLPHA